VAPESRCQAAVRKRKGDEASYLRLVLMRFSQSFLVDVEIDADAGHRGLICNAVEYTGCCGYRAQA
jgi:hypothetical protein